LGAKFWAFWGFEPFSEVLVKLQSQNAIRLRQTASFEPFGLWAVRRNKKKKETRNSRRVRHPATQTLRNRSSPILILGPPMGRDTTGVKFGRSRSRGFRATRVRFSGFPFEWDTAYNNLPCTNVPAVIKDFIRAPPRIREM
jgi:hypothetical protein